MDAAAEIGRNPVSKHQIQPECGDEQADAGRDCRTNPSCETNFSGANGDTEIFIFPVQLTTSRIGNLTRLILPLAIRDDHTYIYTWWRDIIREALFEGQLSNCCCSTGVAQGNVMFFLRFFGPFLLLL